MIRLLPEQLENLRQLQAVCRSLGAEIVMIGATALLCFVDDPHRETKDVDLAVALEMEQMPSVETGLTSRGWRRDSVQEQRWYGPRGGIVDLIPAGARLRAARQVTWPASQMTMSLVGFEHVFREAVERDLAPDLRMRVIPLPVLALLKMAAFLEGRQKDIYDIESLLARYEIDSERRFSDEVYEADLALTFDMAGAFLLGLDVGKLCTAEEAEIVERFLDEAGDEEHPSYAMLAQARGGLEGRDEELRRQVEALAAGFRRTRKRT
jgi:predicted nucleotidyltransferase